MRKKNQLVVFYLIILMCFYCCYDTGKNYNTAFSEQELSLFSKEELNLIDSLYIIHSPDTIKPSEAKRLFFDYKMKFGESYLNDTINTKEKDEFLDGFMKRIKSKKRSIE